jgi:lipopolysaccharide transport system permease protein
MAQLSTDGVPPILFYLSGVTAWGYFANCLKSTSKTFSANAYLFGKVYFPRAVTPISIIISNLIQFGIGLLLFLVIYAYFVIGYDLKPNSVLFLLSFLIVMGLMVGWECYVSNDYQISRFKYLVDLVFSY